MLRSALSLASFSRIASPRSFSTTLARSYQEATKTESAELEDLFYNSESSDVSSKNETHPQGNKKYFAWGINRVELLGGVAADPEFLVTKTTENFSAFRLFTNVNYRKRDGSLVEQREVHDVQVFGVAMVNYLKKNVKKGNRVYVSGRIHYIERADFSRRAIIKADLVQTIAKIKPVNEQEPDQ